MSDLKYKEKQDNLSIRIQAHQKFSNFSLEDWFLQHLPWAIGDVILDIGCGDGNMFSVYDKKLGDRGVIVGIDQSMELLSKARNRAAISSTILLQWDMNNVLPFISESFDHIISTFAVYYADNVQNICVDMSRVLKAGGQINLVGPTDNNARELYAFNEKVFGFLRDEKINIRTNRIENEFYPILTKYCSQTTIERIPSKIIFPDQLEFLRYYKATLLFEESVKKVGWVPEEKELHAAISPPFEISKEMIVLCTKK